MNVLKMLAHNDTGNFRENTQRKTYRNDSRHKETENLKDLNGNARSK